MANRNQTFDNSGFNPSLGQGNTFKVPEASINNANNFDSMMGQKVESKESKDDERMFKNLFSSMPQGDLL